MSGMNNASGGYCWEYNSIQNFTCQLKCRKNNKMLLLLCSSSPPNIIALFQGQWNWPTWLNNVMHADATYIPTYGTNNAPLPKGLNVKVSVASLATTACTPWNSLTCSQDLPPPSPPQNSNFWSAAYWGPCTKACGGGTQVSLIFICNLCCSKDGRHALIRLPFPTKGWFTLWTRKSSQGVVRVLIGCWTRPGTTSVYNKERMTEWPWRSRSPRFIF